MSISVLTRDHGRGVSPLPWSLFFLSVAVFCCVCATSFGQSTAGFRPVFGPLDPGRLSEDQWEKLVRGTIEAIGESSTSSENGEGVDQVGNSAVGDQVDWREGKVREVMQQTTVERLHAFRRLIDELLSREEYVRWYAEGWMQAVCSENARARCEVAGWDDRVYRKWLMDSIRNNDPFDSFLRWHFIGDDRLRSDRMMVPTAAWYLAGHSGEYQVLESPTTIEANLLRPFRESLASIEEAEGRDWDRLKTAKAFEQWYRTVVKFPTPPQEELVGKWTLGDEFPINSQNTMCQIEKTSIALKAFREWSLVLELSLEPQAIGSIVPVLIFEQVSGSSKVAEQGEPRETVSMRVLRISMVDGHVQIGLIHDADSSCILVRTTEVLTPGSHQIVLVNEGTGDRTGIHLVVDGKLQSLESMSTELSGVGGKNSGGRNGDQSGGNKRREALSKELLLGDRAVWRVAVGGESGIKIEQISTFRVALSVPESVGLTEAGIKPDWDDLDEVQKEDWRTHYARRHDAQWRYQRESRLYYLGSIQSIRESVSMIPTLQDARKAIALRNGSEFPGRWLPSMQRKAEVVLDTSRIVSAESILIELGMNIESQTLQPEAVERIALVEIERIWEGLLRRVGENGNGDGNALVQERFMEKGHRADIESSLRDRVAIPFAKNWDRRLMLQSILVSEAWVRVLLDDD